jgi:hypothetical protein
MLESDCGEINFQFPPNVLPEFVDQGLRDVNKVKWLFGGGCVSYSGNGGNISLHVGVTGVHVFALLVSQFEKPQDQQIAH